MLDLFSGSLLRMIGTALLMGKWLWVRVVLDADGEKIDSG
jgi:hypothetical protein